MENPLESALRALPHGPEFRFLDHIVQLDPGISGIGEYTVKGDDSFLRGHFPGRPMMPGVLMIEALAQLVGTVAQTDLTIGALPNLRLTALRGVKIFGSAIPGQRLRIQAEITGRLANLIQAHGSVSLEAKLLLEADLTLSGDVGEART
jgi:3-hydroxyacyl-[acyl-carrier-protein] dehydratase